MTSSCLTARALALTLTCVFAFLPLQLGAAAPLVKVTSKSPGLTPFIRLVHLHLDDTSLLSYVQFTITPKAGSVTRAVSARYSSNYLATNGFVKGQNGEVTVPVFGLYQNYPNTVELVSGFVDGSSQAGGPISAADLAAAVPTQTMPLERPLGGTKVAFLPPPAEAGLAAEGAFNKLRANQKDRGGAQATGSIRAGATCTGPARRAVTWLISRAIGGS